MYPQTKERILKKYCITETDTLHTTKLMIFGKSSTEKSTWNVVSLDPLRYEQKIFARLAHREWAVIVSVGGDEAMIVGGRFSNGNFTTVEVCNFKSKLSRRVPPLNFARYRHGACGVGNTVFVCGGTFSRFRRRYHRKWEILRSCEIYSRTENRWIMVPDMNTARHGAAVVSLPDRRVVVIGGRGEDSEDRDCYLKSVEMCKLSNEFVPSSTPSAEFWQSLPPMKTARFGHAAALFEANILVAGGFINGNLDPSSTEIFPIDIEDGQWISINTQLIDERSFFTLLIHANMLFALGNNAPPCNTMEKMQIENSTYLRQSNNAIQVQWNILPSLTIFERIWGAVSV